MPPGPQAGSSQACPESICIPGFGIVRVPLDASSAVRLRSPSRLTPDALSRSAVSATFTTPAVVPAQLAAVGNLRLRGGSEGPTLIANAALLRVVLSTWDYPPHSWHKN